MERIDNRMELGWETKKIKKNVWKLEREGQYYSAKRYHSGSIAMKVDRIHDALHSISFSHIVPVVPGDDRLLFIQPWLEGARPVNFKKRADRTDSLSALHALHDTNRQLDWQAESYLHSYPLLSKWENRISRFRELGGECEAYIGKGKVNEILFYALNAISAVKATYQDHVNVTLLHGDVVHHNILRDSTGIIRFIDFDLACTGPEGTEIALWIHRVLPKIDYDIGFLFDEQPSLKSLDKASRNLLLFPNELLREWLYFFSLSPASRERQAKQLIPFTESALSHWPKLWYDIERMNE